MKCSVIIPAYNAEATIRATLDSALNQTVAADEIIMMDDGSTDQTASILKSYGDRILRFSQPNAGLASARNELCKIAKGDLIAFLDSDDLWHPRYLEVQLQLFKKFPDAAGFFTGHKNIQGYADCDWDTITPNIDFGTEVIAPLAFQKRYNEAPGPFNMIVCCVPRRVVRGIGDRPFRSGSLGVAEDCYFHNLLPLWGPVVYNPAVLAVYRMTPGSLSSSRLRQTGGEVEVFELLENVYDHVNDPKLLKAFRTAFASKCRSHAKILLGDGQVAQARVGLRRSLTESASPRSFAKSLALLLLSHMPSALQPRWPSVRRSAERPTS